MIVRSGRLLPSVIVGVLVSGAVALGAGTASAAEDGDPCHVLLRQGVVQGDKCVTSGGVLIAPLVEALLGPAPDPESSATTSARSGVVPEVVGGVGDTVAAVGNAVTGNAGSAGGGSQGTGTAAGTAGSGAASSDGGAATGTQAGGGAAAAAGPAQAAAPAPAALPAPDVRGAVAPAAAPSGLLTELPTLGFGRPNPGLFAPLGSPLRTLTGVSPGSPVTTSSDVQAMAFDSLPGGLGTPAITGVVILSVLGAFALRHRIFRRARTSAAAES